jgi:hypothetical protein
MSAAAPSAKAAAWIVAADIVPTDTRAGRRSRVWLAERRDKSARAGIVCALFLVLIAAALLIGGQAAIDPLLRSAIAARETKALGDVFYAMPDGVYCRHMSFDNATAEVIEGALEPCSRDIAIEHSASDARSKRDARSTHASNGFTWDTR